MRRLNTEQWIKAQAIINTGHTPSPRHAAPAPTLSPARGRRGILPLYRRVWFALTN